MPPDQEGTLAEKVWAMSSERFLVLCWISLNRNMEWGLLGKDSPEREQRETEQFQELWKMGKSQFRWFLNHNYPVTSIFFLSCIFLSAKCPSKLLKSTLKEVLFIILKQDQELLSAPFLDCLCKTGASSYSCFNQSKKDRNLSLLSIWTVSAGQASLPRQLISSFTGPFGKSCLSL